MTEPKTTSQYMSFSPEIAPHGVKVTCIDDAPDVREYLTNLRREFIRRLRELDELIARMPQGKP